jgi:hypothetical protein
MSVLNLVSDFVKCNHPITQISQVKRLDIIAGDIKMFSYVKWHVVIQAWSILQGRSKTGFV